ncbi:MAG TPA: glycosyltransferase family 39 protein [Actinomycetota bacterium]|jgi:hypothetical protein
MSGPARIVARIAPRTHDPSRPDPAQAGPAPPSRLGNVGLAGPLLVGGALAACIALRFLARSDLWLDEALSVNIARPSFAGLLDALRRDGSPPAYYFLLHGWMRLVGTGDHAVRTLSGIISVLTLPVAWVVGRRVGGRAVGWGVVLLLASSPFAIRYASETRMYSMLVLGALLLYLAWTEALRRPAAGRLLILAATTALLLLTHYWAFYVVGALFGVTGVRVLRGVKGDRRAAALTLAAIACGAIPFLPWLPSFLFQLHHTGTPWGKPPDLKSLRSSLQAWTDSGKLAGIVLGWMLVLLAATAVFDRRPESAAGEPAPGDARDLCLVVLGTFALAIVAGRLFHVSFAARYTSVVMPLFLLLAALGLRSFPARSRWIVMGVAVGCGMAVAIANVNLKRTQTGDVARVLRSRATAGDLIVYCPDQLGPGTSRLAPADVPQTTFPGFGAPGLVDWVDYKQRYATASPAAFAREAERRAGSGRIWLVYSGRYNVAGRPCARLTKQLAALRPPQKPIVRPNYHAYENAWLLLYAPASSHGTREMQRARSLSPEGRAR